MQHEKAKTGAWLALEGSSESSSAMLFESAAADPPSQLTPTECTALTSAMLAWRASDAGGLREALQRACVSFQEVNGGGVLAAWVATLAPAETQGNRAVLRAADRVLLERLGRALTLAALPSARSSEARLLADALELLREHLALQETFEAQLAEARLEAVRQMAYGAGHEINNPLANIATRGQSLLRDEPDPERRRKLATIVDQAFRARDMIGGLMVFAKPPAAHPGRVDLRDVVASVVASLEDRAAEAGAVLAADGPAGEVWAWADATLVAEALHAVVLNALEAVPAGGRVSVAVDAGRGAGFQSLVVSDDGPGMNLDEQAVACDPFHCGREAGRGLGIGLSKAWALVKACGGSLSVNSAAGEGTTVRLELPVDGGKPSATSTQTSQTPADGCV